MMLVLGFSVKSNAKMSCAKPKHIAEEGVLVKVVGVACEWVGKSSSGCFGERGYSDYHLSFPANS